MENTLAPKSESRAQKTLTICLLILCVAINLLPVCILLLCKPEREMANIFTAFFTFLIIMPICLGLGAIFALNAAFLSKGIVRKILGFALGGLDILAIIYALILVVFK